MEITKNNLPGAIAALRRCAKENKGKQTDTGCIVVSDLCLDVADYLEKSTTLVWHDASEEPEPNKELICIGEFNNPLVLSSNSDSFKKRTIIKWAYFDDLLKL